VAYQRRAIEEIEMISLDPWMSRDRWLVALKYQASQWAAYRYRAAIIRARTGLFDDGERLR
jgi:hypothetical protein